MCGIVAVLPVYDGPAFGRSAEQVLAALDQAEKTAERAVAELSPTMPSTVMHQVLLELQPQLRDLLDAFSATSISHALLVNDVFRSGAELASGRLSGHLDALDAWLDDEADRWHPDQVEATQQALRAALDLAWSIREDRVLAALRVRSLAGPAGRAAELTASASIGFWALDAALDAINRLEVRGRDSAGVHLWISLDAADLARVPAALAAREDVLFGSGAAVRLVTSVSVVFKTASVIGRLGDNVRVIRDQLAADTDVQAVLRLPSARVTVLGHTRWASVGRINQANAHPLNNLTKEGVTAGRYAVGVLNGDIDNHLELREREGLPSTAGITTDAKVIPVMLAQRLSSGLDGPAAMAGCLQQFEGSMAIAVQADDDLDRLVLAVKGGGQGLYVGLSPFGYVVTSEVFGLVARSDSYISLEGLAGAQIKDRGAVLVTDRRGGGELAGIHRVDEAGIRHPVDPIQIRMAELTTRDVAPRGYERYLEKELAEAPVSFRKTLRGRIHTEDGRLSLLLPSTALPERTAAQLRSGGFDEIIVIGQGTAAVAASGVAFLVNSLLRQHTRVSTLPASELSASRLPRDMSRTCIIAVSQSGTTTDTNRTVDLVHDRGATVLAIVNRRQSDLVAKSDGVLFTGDGRDIEMAVASTKAFYAQIAAGMLLGIGLAKAAGVLDRDREDEHLRMLVEIPGKLAEVQERKQEIAEVAARVCTRHTYWAVVGSGANRIAASEVRIKLSELCYRGVALDAVEDKKHIDLSAESLILVCAAGSPVTQLSDLAKEVAIFSAHHNTPVVIAERGSAHLWNTENLIEVPAAHPTLAWVLSTAAGHLFSYFAARAIDAAADDLRAALAAIDETDDDLVTDHRPRNQVSAAVTTPLGRFVEGSLRGELRGVLTGESSTRLAAAYWYLTRSLPAEVLLAATGLELSADPHDAVRQALMNGVEELSRSIDSVKHQAKTVTVGTSRSGAELFDSALARAVLDIGVQHEGLSYATLLALQAYARVVQAVDGATRYAITDSMGQHQIRVVRKTGVAQQLSSRAEHGAVLSGTKKLAVDTRAVRLERGRIDGRIVLVVPDMAGQRVAGLTLLHLSLLPRASSAQLVAAAKSAGSRWAEIEAAVTEQNVKFEPEILGELPVEVALLAPVDEVAAKLIAWHDLPPHS